MRTTSVKQHFRAGKIVRKHSRKLKSYIITPKQRVTFSMLAKQPIEIGGQMKFNKDKLDHAKIHFGTDTNTEWEWDPKYTASFHTHPNVPGSSIMPSFDDIVSMREGKEKAQVIFKDVQALSIAETDKFQKVSTSKMKEISDKLQEDFDNGKSDKEMYKKFKPILKKDLGLDMEIHPPEKAILFKAVK